MQQTDRHTTAQINHTGPSSRSLTIFTQEQLASHAAEGRRLSWPEHTVGYQLARGCLQTARISAEPVTQKL